MNNKENKKVLVIGLDGATPDLLFPLAIEGKLPNLNRIIKDGASGTLTSTYPPLSGPAWASFMTGKNPGKHGVFHFIERKKDGFNIRLLNAKDIHAKSLWSILSESGKKVGVMHIPLTYPPERVNGFLISGLGTPVTENDANVPNSDFTYPIDLKEKLKELNYKIHVALKDKIKEDELLRDIHYTTEKRAESALYFIKNYDWNFFMVVFEGTDYVQHFFWKYMDKSHPAYNPAKAKIYGNAIFDYYQKIDGIIGEIIKQLDDNTTVIIMSDHGFGPLHKEVHLNTWLKSIGLLKLKKKADKMSIPKYWLLKHGFSKERFWNLLMKFNLVKLTAIIPKKIRDGMPTRENSFSIIDWTKTKAYSFGYMGMMYINLKGREPEGIVTPEEYDELRDYIIKELYKIRDPENGKKIVDKVFKKEEIYSGPYINKAPDLYILTDMKYVDVDIGDLDGTFIKPAGKSYIQRMPAGRSGQHRLHGIFLIKGKNINKGTKINGRIIDIAPTILYAMGVPIPSDMDGKVLKDVFEPPYLESEPIQYKDILQKETPEEFEVYKEDEEIVKERLRNLGYLS